MRFMRLSSALVNVFFSESHGELDDGAAHKQADRVQQWHVRATVHISSEHRRNNLALRCSYFAHSKKINMAVRKREISMQKVELVQRIVDPSTRALHTVTSNHSSCARYTAGQPVTLVGRMV